MLICFLYRSGQNEMSWVIPFGNQHFAYVLSTWVKLQVPYCLCNKCPHFWNQLVDKMPQNHSKWVQQVKSLCWFQTSLPLCRYAAWSSLAVSELQLSAATPLWLYHRAASLPSWIEFNCLRSAVVGKAARLSIYWLDAACRLVIPLRQVALAQLNKYYHQSSNAASGKLVWNQH